MVSRSADLVGDVLGVVMPRSNAAESDTFDAPPSGVARRLPRTVVQALHAAGAPASFVELSSPYGHDAFLLDSPEMNRVVAGFLRNGG